MLSKNLKHSIAWGISGSGDRIEDIVKIMKEIKKKYENIVNIKVYLSKAGIQVVRYYRLLDELRTFGRLGIEIDSNSPFLAGQLQTGKFEFLLIAPATSNSVAKISLGIADSLLSNSAIMALKAFVPVYVMPSDYQEGIIMTKLPSGKNLKLRIRSEDVDHVKRLSTIDGVIILREPKEIKGVFSKYFNEKKM